jgi:hypothetical protein
MPRFLKFYKKLIDIFGVHITFLDSNEGFFFQSNSKEKLVLNLEAKDVMNVKCFLCSFEFSDVASIATTARNDNMILEPIQKVIMFFFSNAPKTKIQVEMCEENF